MSRFMDLSAVAQREPNPAATRFCFTWNNWDEHALELCRSLAYDDDFPVRYVCWSQEIAPTTGTPHLQGYVVFRHAVRFKAVCQLLYAAHVIVSSKDATTADNVRYCSKGRMLNGVDTFEEYGDRPLDVEEQRIVQSTKRQVDWQAVKDAAKSGNLEAIPASIFVRSYSTLSKIAAAYAIPPPPRDELFNFWICGPSGIGKSMLGKHRIKELGFSVFYKPANDWFDCYQGEDCIFIEDWDPFCKKMGRLMKIWSDHSAFVCEIKGTSRYIRPKVVIVTSNYTISQCWDDMQTVAPLERRFHTINFFNDAPFIDFNVVKRRLEDEIIFIKKEEKGEGTKNSPLEID